MRVRILPYGPSKSARALSQATGFIRIKLNGTKFRIDDGDIVINWGASKYPLSWYRGDHGAVLGKVINEDTAVNRASSKRISLQVMKEGGVNVPEFTSDRQQAENWLNNGKSVLCRTLDRASGGRGITLCSPGDSLTPAGLYTLYIPKYDEYRVHVWGTEVIDVQQKRRRSGHEQVNNQIRNASNGWVFCREGVEPPEVVLDQARRAVASLGLDFGAVDIGYTRATACGTVYEVNTAPGLEGTTLTKYAEMVVTNVEQLLE